MFTDKKFDKNSLLTQFLFLFISVFLLFFSLMTFSYLKFIEHKEFIYTILNSSIPQVIRLSSVHTNIRELSFLTDKMIDAKNNALVKIYYRKVLNNIEFIENSDIKFDKEYLQNIKKELKTISKLVKKDVVYNNQIDKKIKDLDRLYEILVEHFSRRHDNYEITKEIRNMQSSLILDDYFQPDDFATLKTKMEKQYTRIRKHIKHSQAQHPAIDIQKILFGKDNILDLYIDKYENKNQIKRDWAFLRTLMNNFSNEIRYASVKKNQVLVESVDESLASVEMQTNMILVFHMACLAYLIFIAFYFRNKIIRRLMKLSRFIDSRSMKDGKLLFDNGKDEISYITQSFNMYAGKLERLTVTDSLTGLANKRLFETKFQNELLRVKSKDDYGSCLMIDIDNFKLYNDHYGHLEGDECLKLVAKALSSVIKRDADLLARYGGEEFICILSNTDTEGSKIVANLLIRAVNTLKIPHKFSECSEYITISIGIQTFYPKDCEKPESIIDKADKALYEAKKIGKNTFVHYAQM